MSQKGLEKDVVCGGPPAVTPAWYTTVHYINPIPVVLCKYERRENEGKGKLKSTS